jgi:hypothetical protein
VAFGYSGLAGELAATSGGTGKDYTTDRAPVGAGSPAELASGTVIETIKRHLLRNPVERAVFDLVTIYLRKNREIKVRLYPSLAYFIFYPLLAIFSEGLFDPFVKSRLALFPLLGAAMVCFVSSSATEALLFSEDYEAAYIFDVAPLVAIEHVYAGFRKAILVYIAWPGCAVLFILYSILWRNPFDAFLILIPWAIVAPAVLLVPFLVGRRIPLARKYQKGQQSSRNLATFMFNMIGLSGMLGLQMLAVSGTIPYWLFVILVTVPSWLFYLLASRPRTRVQPLWPGP